MVALSNKNVTKTLLLLQHRSWLVVLFETAIVFLSLVTAVLLRFDFALPSGFHILQFGFILIVIRLAAMARYNLLHGWWRYAGFNEAMDVVKSTFIGSVAFVVVVHWVLWWDGLPLSVYLTEGLLTTAFLAGSRMLSRLIAESVERNAAAKRVVLIGAGYTAQSIIREARRANSGFEVIACFDDNRSKIGMKLEGVPVVSTVDELPEKAASYGASEAIICVPSANGEQMRRFVDVCEKARLPVRTVPAVRELVLGKAAIPQLREVKVEDLLARKPVRIDLETVRRHIQNQVVMVTGAAGSIGSELCNQILEFDPKLLVCVDHNENGVFYLKMALATHRNGSRIHYCVGDVGDSAQMQNIVANDAVQIIFHAAAHKHVPMMESNVAAAVKNNVFGLIELLDVADRYGVHSFVLISSDKAVNPTNVMGCTKRICELIVASRPTNTLRCVGVRFGNVLGSNGSVVPIFQQQLRTTGTLTVTHPKIKRFFMTTREAVSLVLEAFSIGSHRDIMVLDMGEQIAIVDLARTLIRLSGKSEDEIEIRFTGLRDGEKLLEELFYPNEDALPTSAEKIKRTRAHYMHWEELRQHLVELRDTLYLDGGEPIRRKMREIVPQFEHAAGLPQPIEPAPRNVLAATARQTEY